MPLIPGAPAPDPLSPDPDALDPTTPAELAPLLGSNYHVQTVRLGPAVVHSRVAGDLDYLVTPRLRRHLLGQMRDDVRVLVVDLEAVTLLSAAAIETLLAVDHLAGARRARVRVVATRRAVLRPLHLTGVDARLALFTTVDDAVGAE